MFLNFKQLEINRRRYLAEKLYSNKLSKKELSEFLSDIGERCLNSDYDLIFRKYFNSLLMENKRKNIN